MPMIDDATVSYGNQSANTGDISTKGLAYLLQYGWSQSLQDAAAGVGAEVKAAAKAHDTSDTEAHAKAVAKWERLVKEAGFNVADPDVAVDVAAMTDAIIAARQAKRAAAIVAGTVGEGARGPRLDPMARMVRIVAEEMLRATYAAKKAAGANLGPLPTGADLTALVDRYAEKNADKVRAEAERRIAATADAGADEDIDDLLPAAS